MKVHKKGNNSKIIVFTETKHLKFVPGNVLSESDMYLFYSTYICNQYWHKIILISAIFYAPIYMANYGMCVYKMLFKNFTHLWLFWTFDCHWHWKSVG